jgi:hypothetical protein
VDGRLAEESLGGAEGDWTLTVLVEKSLLDGMGRWALEI